MFRFQGAEGMEMVLVSQISICKHGREQNLALVYGSQLLAPLPCMLFC